MAASASTAVLARTVMILRMMVDLPFFFWLGIVRSSLRRVTHPWAKTSVALEYRYGGAPREDTPEVRDWPGFAHRGLKWMRRSIFCPRQGGGPGGGFFWRSRRWWWSAEYSKPWP